MSDPSLFDVVRAQRAHRAFRADPVDDELVERVLEAATFAPSAENLQPWVFVVIRDAALRAGVGELTARAWSGRGREHARTRLSAALFADVDRGASGGVSAAPVVVVVGGDISTCEPTVLQSSIFPAVQNLLLAAQALGLGSALTTLTTTFSEELRTLLYIPEHIRPMAVVPLGWPARALGPPRRAPVADKTHRDRFGTPW